MMLLTRILIGQEHHFENPFKWRHRPNSKQMRKVDFWLRVDRIQRDNRYKRNSFTQQGLRMVHPIFDTWTHKL